MSCGLLVILLKMFNSPHPWVLCLPTGDFQESVERNP